MPQRRELADQLLHLAKARQQTIATAESCTGGWIGKTLTEPAGSSAVFKGGIIAYSNQAKTNLLGVPEDNFSDGAVSETVAKSMAQGALERFDVDLAISVTGIAGPSGGSDSKPIGTVCFGLAKRGASPQTIRQDFGNKGRDSIREQAVIYALEWLIESLSGPK